MSIARFTEVSPNLYRGGAPTEEDVGILKSLYGVQLIISLDESTGNKIDKACKKYGVQHVIKPVHEMIENGVDLVMEELKSTKATELIGDKVAFVHCKHGKDRTGMFVAKYRVENGWSPKKAVEEAVSFGFGVGCERNVQDYLDVINSAATEDFATLEDYNKLFGKVRTKSTCENCGKIKYDSGTCTNCASETGETTIKLFDDAGDAATETRDTMNKILDSDPMSAPTIDQSISGVTGSLKYPKAVRKGIVGALHKYIVAQQHEVSSQVTAEDVALAKRLIKQFTTLISLIDTLILKDVQKFIELLKTVNGITPELIKEVKAEPYFSNLGKNIKKNCWNLVGNKYIDVAEDIDENKTKKENMGDTDGRKSPFEVCLDGFSKFNKDTLIGPMQSSLEDAMKGLVDLVVDLADFVEEKIETKEFQPNLLKLLEAIEQQTATIKSLIKDRVIFTLNKDVVGSDKPHENKEVSVLQQVVNNKR